MDNEALDGILTRCGVDWPNFMDAPDGELYADQVLFFYRVGLYFEKPYEAIMAHNQFVRLRRNEAFGAFDLLKLNAERPNSCLYSLPDSKGLTRIWLPHRLKQDPNQYWSTLAGQAAQNVFANPVPPVYGQGLLCGGVGQTTAFPNTALNQNITTTLPVTGQYTLTSNTSGS